MSPTPGVISKERLMARGRSLIMSASNLLDFWTPGLPLNVAEPPDPAMGLRPRAIISLFGLLRIFCANVVSIASLHAPFPPGPVQESPLESCDFCVLRAISSGSYTFNRLVADAPSPPAIPGRSR